MNRRSLLLGLGGALAAPAIVRAENLMKIYVPRRPVFGWDLAFGPDQTLFTNRTATEVLNQAMLDAYLTGYGAVSVVPNRLIVPRGPYRDLLKGLAA